MNMRKSIFVLALLVACQTDGKDSGNNTTSTTTATTGVFPVDLVVVEPSFEQCVSGQAPLTRLFSMQTERAVRVSVTLDDGERSRTWNFAEFATDHQIPVVGFKADRTWTVSLSLTEENGDTWTYPETLEVVAGPLPSIFPIIDVQTLEVASTQPGFTIFNMRTTGNGGGEPTENWMMLDEWMEPIWVAHQVRRANLMIQHPDGRLLGLSGHEDFSGSYVSQRSLCGQETAAWHTDEGQLPTWVQGTYAFHHDIYPMPGGTLAVLAKSGEGFAVDNFPVSYTNSAARQDGLVVNADVIVEFQEDGTIVDIVPISPLIDGERIGWDALDNSASDGRLDWTHANGLDYDEANDAYIVSMRHQDAVVSIDRQTHDLRWILGTHVNWAPRFDGPLLDPDASVSWQYHQHSPNLRDDGNALIVFDNGNHRASPWDGTPNPDDQSTEITSRIVEYGIDQDAGTVQLNWEFEPPSGQHACPAIGGARYLDNGNVLATFGIIVALDGVPIQDQGYGDQAARFLEFAPGEPHDVVMDVLMSTDPDVFEGGWQVFRASRIPSPYGPDFTTD